MECFLGIVRYEYRMSIRRWGLWIAFGVLYLFHAVSTFSPGGFEVPAQFTTQILWETAGQFVFTSNLFMPVVAGIVAADRMARDVQIGVAELLGSTRITRWQYILGKYCGVLLSVLTPVFLFILVFSLVLVFYFGAPREIIPLSLLAFLTISVPTYIFITIFSLGCPLVMPVRVYQVLFTGYWFWGNWLSPEFIPTISQTPLNAAGIIPLIGFFGSTIPVPEWPSYSSAYAALNLFTLVLCTFLAMLATERLLRWQSHRV